MSQSKSVFRSIQVGDGRGHVAGQPIELRYETGVTITNTHDLGNWKEAENLEEALLDADVLVQDIKDIEDDTKRARESRRVRKLLRKSCQHNRQRWDRSKRERIIKFPVMGVSPPIFIAIKLIYDPPPF